MTRQWLDFLFVLPFLVALPLAARADQGVSALVKTQRVAPRKMRQTVTGYGVVRADPHRITVVSAAHGGQIDRVWVSLGDLVKPGAKLLELSTDPSATLAFHQAEAELAYARGQMERVRQLYRQQLATKDQLAAAEKALANARAGVAAQKRLGNDRANSVMRAPYGGIVTRVQVAPGDRVQTGMALVQLAKRDDLQVALGIEPDLVSRLRVGMPVSLTSVFDSQRRVQTRLSNIHLVVNPSSRLVDAVVNLEGQAAQRFLPGMQVRGVITLREDKPLAVPRSAVLKDSRGSYLFVVRGGHAHRVQVQVHTENGGYVGVAGDLKAGESVVTLGNYELKDGMAVREAGQ